MVCAQPISRTSAALLSLSFFGHVGSPPPLCGLPLAGFVATGASDVFRAFFWRSLTKHEFYFCSLFLFFVLSFPLFSSPIFLSHLCTTMCAHFSFSRCVRFRRWVISYTTFRRVPFESGLIHVIDQPLSSAEPHTTQTQRFPCEFGIKVLPIPSL